MPRNKYISLILFTIFLATLFHLFRTPPELADRNHLLYRLSHFVDAISKTACSVEGFQCPSDTPCDCEALCANGAELVPFQVIPSDRIYVRNRKLAPGAYCLPKGVGQCNLATSVPVFSWAGWSCLSLNDDVFLNDKKIACQNAEARDNRQNVLWDMEEDAPADPDIRDYYELYQTDLRYQCLCGSEALDGTRMVSVFPFACSVDYCLRDIENPMPGMGWNGSQCDCGPYEHLDPNDLSSPCQMDVSKILNDVFTGRVPCMNETSYVQKTLICPSDDSPMQFQVDVFEKDPVKFIDYLITQRII